MTLLLLVFVLKSFKNCKPPEYMTSTVKYFNTRFADNPNSSAQLISLEVGQSMDFWDFSVQKKILVFIK